MNDPTHPSAAELRLLILNRLDATTAQRLESHVDSCTECHARLDGMDFCDDETVLPSAPSLPLGLGAAFAGKDETSLPTPEGFELLGLLGQGGMGVVCRARNLRLRRMVALKFLSARDLQGGQRERFRREAEAVAALLHPNIVQVFSVGEAAGQPYLEMEYVEGPTLQGKLASGPLPAGEAARLVQALARAVQHAHDRGILHRDLKPGNVLLQEASGGRKEASGGRKEASGGRKEASGGRKPPEEGASEWLHAGSGGLRPPLAGTIPKITDFGLAKRLDDDASAGPANQAALTQTGAIMGTPSYMAPEQALGRANEVGRAADVWALGTILYECLAGRPAFQAATVLETLEQVCTQEPVPPRRLQSKVPRDLETICLKCLHKEVGKRYGSAAELADDLQRFLNNEPIRARPTPRWERAWKWCRRRPATAGGLAAAIVLLLAGLTGGLWYWDAQLRTTVEYYRTQSIHWGVPRGIGLLNRDAARQRHRTLKFYRRAGRVVKVEVVNGHDLPAPQRSFGAFLAGVSPQEEEKGECSFEYQYNQAGDLATETARDRAGRIVWALHYTSRNLAHYTDARGYVRSPRGSEAAWVEFAWSKDGLDEQQHYRDGRGQPQPEARGAYGRREAFNERGLPVKVTFLDAEGKPVCTRDGFATARVEYDRDSNIVEQRFLDVAGKPALHREGYAVAKMDYDEFGNLTRVAYLGTDGKPTLHREGYAIERRHYDEWGNLTERAYFDRDDRPTLNKQGFHKVRLRPDERGNVVEWAFLGRDGKPTLHRHGYSVVRFDHDEQGNRVEAHSYFGLDGKPTVGRQGFHKVKRGHDDNGNLVEIAYFGVDGKPTLHPDGNAIVRWRHDQRGNKVKEAYFDRDGKPTVTRDGSAAVKMGYDERGNLVELAYFGLDGKPVLTRERIHKARFRHNEVGNVVERSFFDRDGKPALHRDGYAVATTRYDERGNKAEAAYFDRDGKPALHTAGNASVKWRYDERGNLVEQAYFGLDGKPTQNKSGNAIVRWRHDERGNRVEEAYFDRDGKPTETREGAQKVQMRYDERDNLVERASFDRAGKPVLLAGRIHRIRSAYDLRGNKIEQAYFDGDGKPVLHPDRNAIVRWRYDQRDKVVEQAFFDRDGKPIRTVNGYARQVLRYDERGELIDVAYLDEAGRPVPACVVITQVGTGSEAARAGLRVGDVVSAYDGEAIRNTGQAAAVLRRATGKAGQVPVQVRRAGKDLRLLVRPGTLGVRWEDRVLRR